MKTWVKLYTEILDDPKVGSLSWAERGIWSAILALAGKLDHRDEDDAETGKLDILENIAWHIRCPADELAAAMEAFTNCGMVSERDGVYFVTNYGKRQAKPPSARRPAVAERQRRYRKKQDSRDEVAEHSNEDVTRRNEDVTTLRRGVTSPESESDTESDTELGPETKTATGAGAPGASPKLPQTTEKSQAPEPDPSLAKARQLKQAIAGLAESMADQGATPSGNGKSPAARKKRPSKADPRTAREEIRRFRAVTGRLPPKPRYDDVINGLAWCSDAQAAAIYARWKESGYNPANPDWVEWAQKAHAPPAQGGRGE